MEMDEFIAQVSQQPLPTHPMDRVRLLAKELAAGAAAGLWDVYLYTFRWEPNEDNVIQYLEKRWNKQHPNLEILVSSEYLTKGNDVLILTRSAFDLLDEAEPANIFISYKRSESSAFALLVLARLKAAGLEPFVDLSLVPGENWQAGLRERIQKYDYLIALLGKDTLHSEVVQEEITMALDAGLTILPVWHNGFTYKSGEWDNIPVKIDKLLSTTHTIRVIEESALAYNNAIVELLNRFGVTP
jgi:hypothetical protein